MALRGTLEKIDIFNKMIETFEGAFWEDPNKILRIPINGVEVKVALTCAKDNLREAGSTSTDANAVINTPAAIEITEEEKEEVRALMKFMEV